MIKKIEITKEWMERTANHEEADEPGGLMAINPEYRKLS